MSKRMGKIDWNLRVGNGEKVHAPDLLDADKPACGVYAGSPTTRTSEGVTCLHRACNA